MKNTLILSNLRLFSAMAALIWLSSTNVMSCTIVSGIAHNGHVWTANNEDGPFGVANFINVFPRSGNAKYGYYTLSYFSPREGMGGGIQGGMNEAGLTFDFNAISPVKRLDHSAKKPFEKGDDQILPHLLANMSSVEEVIAFFEEYWFQSGFTGAQMHVSDRQGRFALISPSGIQLVEKGQPLVSTNFDICGNEDGAYCWRYPIASRLITQQGASLATMTQICRETAQKNGGTMYSNVHNLTTGDIWFFSKHDPGTTIKTNIHDMLSRGAGSYSFSDLAALTEVRDTKWTEPKAIELPGEALTRVSGKYHNSFLGDILVQEAEKSIRVTFSNGQVVPLLPQSENMFYLPEEKISIAFGFDEQSKQMTMSLHENGYWSFTAWKSNTDQ